MTLTNLEKTPWPWYGGKADAAPATWEAMGDVAHYVEPFAGSLAVLLRRPLSPDAMADAASWPVCEADYDTEHGELEALGWRVVEWYRAGFLKGGMGNTGGGGQQKRERLWMSPHCLGAVEARQGELW